MYIRACECVLCEWRYYVDACIDPSLTLFCIGVRVDTTCGISTSPHIEIHIYEEVYVQISHTHTYIHTSVSPAAYTDAYTRGDRWVFYSFFFFFSSHTSFCLYGERHTKRLRACVFEEGRERGMHACVYVYVRLFRFTYCLCISVCVCGCVYARG